MRKLFAILFSFVIILSITTVSFADVTLLSRDGVEIHALDTRLSDSDPPFINVYVYAANDMDRKIWVSVQDAAIDGVPVRSAGLTLDAGSEYSDDYTNIMLMTTEEDPDGSAAAILNAHILEMDLVVRDDSTYKELFREHASLDLTSLGDDDPSSLEDVSYSPSDASLTIRKGYDPYTPIYASIYFPASENYQTLSIGSTGQAVKDLQQRLTDLGYLNDVIDSSYGLNTATAVMSFCMQNGLYISGDASPEMQELLYSSSAEYYVEPIIPLMIGPRFRYDPPYFAENDIGDVYFQVVNRGHRTIRGYELYYYLEDVWGNKYADPTTQLPITRMTTMTQRVESGYNLDTPAVAVFPFSWAYDIVVGIHKIVFDDGEIREVDPDDVLYFTCVLK